MLKRGCLPHCRYNVYRRLHFCCPCQVMPIPLCHPCHSSHSPTSLWYLPSFFPLPFHTGPLLLFPLGHATHKWPIRGVGHHWASSYLWVVDSWSCDPRERLVNHRLAAWIVTSGPQTASESVDPLASRSISSISGIIWVTDRWTDQNISVYLDCPPPWKKKTVIFKTMNACIHLCPWHSCLVREVPAVNRTSR